MELGDVEEAYRHLEVCQRVGAELGQPMVWYFIVMHVIAEPLLTGDIPKADRAAAAFLELGESQGQPDVGVFSGVQQFWIRYEQGRLDELEQLFLDLIARYPEAPLVKTMLALLYCELDRSEEARSIWDLVGPSLCGGLPVNQVWAMTVTNGAATCAALGDTDRAAALDRLLCPYGDQMVYAFGVSTGFIAHYLGLLAVTLGRIDEAEARFAAAAAAHERIGAPAWLARTRLAWARMLLARPRPGDAERARGLLDQALATARSLGLAGVERHARSLHEQLEASR
jgi:tetratricopeptide (TPR) repeat protein